MNSNKFWAAASRVLAVVTVVVILMTGTATASEFRVLHTFQGKDGKWPRAGVVLDAAGNLYATTYGGGTHGLGVVLQLAPNPDGSWTESVLHNFTRRKDGAEPVTTPLLDEAGNLFATTVAFGGYGYGGVFKLTPRPDGRWTERVLYDFQGGADGNYPNASLVRDSSGNLYGETDSGGAYNQGTVYELTPNSDGSWNYKVIHSFAGGKDGMQPEFGLILDSKGNLFGTTVNGGTYGRGVVFELTPKPSGIWREKVLHAFKGPTDGFPWCRLAADSEGGLYGTAGDIVFKLTPTPAGKWTYSILYKFRGGSEGSLPNGVTLDAMGNLYCSTAGGRYGWGTLFKLTRQPGNTWKGTVLYDFTGHSDGGEPGYQQLVFDKSGNLYGTTVFGGFHGRRGFGVIFELTP